MSKKSYIPIIVSSILIIVYGIYTYFDNETFNLVFTPEKYKVSSLIVYCAILAVNFIFYLSIYLGAKDKIVKMAGRLLLIAIAFDFANIVLYSVMFSIDSTNFTERFPDIIEGFKFFYSYMSVPIYMVALGLMIYQIQRLFANGKLQ